MKLEYLPFGAEECPLVRLYDFDSTQANRLIETVSRLAEGLTQSVLIHEEPYVQSIGECYLTLTFGPYDRGVLKVAEPAIFESILTQETWDNVIGLIEPFSHGAYGGFQWLDRTSDIALLLSPKGTW